MGNYKQLEEAKEVLKNPFDCSLRDLESALKETFTLTRIRNVEVRVGYLRVSIGDHYLHLNIYDVDVENFGRFNVHMCRDGITPYLEKHFKYPLLPTEEERTLFEIEFGFEYPLSVDNAPLKKANAPLKVDEVSVGSGKA